VPIWSRARRALLVNPELGIAARGGRLAFEQVFEDRRPYWRSWLAALRVHHWLKNLLLGVPLLTAHAFDAESFSRLAVAFVAFGLIASGSYLLNDLVDLAADRKHPTKRRRPFAAGELPLLGGMAVTVSLLAAGMLLAALVSPLFVLTLAVYLALTLAYSLYLKAYVLVDVMTLAGLYTIRIIAGAAAISVEVSSWLLAFSTFIFMSLALVKRCSELRALAELSQANAKGRDYRVEDVLILSAMGVAAGYLAVLVMALFVDSSSVRPVYQRPYVLWLECPLLLYWISRLWVKTSRGEMNEDPVLYSLRDRASWVVLVAMTLVVLAAI
jgi:4-hydroxybenzoate polyprenyltransferase